MTNRTFFVFSSSSSDRMAAKARNTRLQGRLSSVYTASTASRSVVAVVPETTEIRSISEALAFNEYTTEMYSVFVKQKGRAYQSLSLGIINFHSEIADLACACRVRSLCDQLKRIEKVRITCNLGLRSEKISSYSLLSEREFYFESFHLTFTSLSIQRRVERMFEIFRRSTIIRHGIVGERASGNTTFSSLHRPISLQSIRSYISYIWMVNRHSHQSVAL